MNILHRFKKIILAVSMPLAIVVWLMSAGLMAPTALAYTDGTLLKDASTSNIYVMNNGMKVWVRSAAVFDGCGYDWTKVKTVSDLSSTPIADLIKSTANPNVYRLEKNFKRKLASIEIFQSYSLDWNRVGVVCQNVLDSYSVAPLVQQAGSADIYWVQTDVLRHKMPSWQSFVDHGFNMADVITVNLMEMSSYSEGVAVDTTPEPSSYVAQNTASQQEAQRLAIIIGVDKELSKTISEIKQRADTFSQVKNDANDFISTVRNKMNKYQSSLSMQQSGQRLIDELNNLAFISGKLLDIENARIGTFTSFLGLGNVPSANNFSTSTAQYENYRNQYDLSIAKTESLTETFVASEKTVLEETERQLTEDLERMTRATQALSQLNNILQGINSQLAILDSQIKAKAAEIENEKNRSGPMELIEARLAQLIPVYNSLVNQWNSFLGTKQKIAALTYRIDDYAKYGTLLSAEDRAFLSSLGISF